MTVTVNGDVLEVPASASIETLLAQLSLAGDKVAIERNRDIVSREAWERTSLQPGDVLEIVHFVGGG